MLRSLHIGTPSLPSDQNSETAGLGGRRFHYRAGTDRMVRHSIRTKVGQQAEDPAANEVKTIMSKVLVPFTNYFEATIRHLRKEGLLLATTGSDGKPNVMTIGWATIGSIWSRPMLIVMVRPSRYSYSRLEQVSDFTVNVLPTDLAATAGLCGSVSGRDHEKFAEAHLTSMPSQRCVPLLLRNVWCITNAERSIGSIWRGRSNAEHPRSVL